MRCRAQVFGRAAARSIIRRSILMPIRRRRALPQRRFNRPRHSIRKTGEFILPYDAVRTARDPETVLMAFLQSTYQAAADRGKWDRKDLECGLGEVGKPRQV